jgi:hypothetical protein
MTFYINLVLQMPKNLLEFNRVHIYIFFVLLETVSMQ